MNQSFDVDMAKKLGVNAAIVYEVIRHGIVESRACRRNVRDGFAWAEYSNEALARLFPYLSEKKIDAAVRCLENEGLVRSRVCDDSEYFTSKLYTTAEGFTGWAQSGGKQ